MNADRYGQSCITLVTGPTFAERRVEPSGFGKWSLTWDAARVPPSPSHRLTAHGPWLISWLVYQQVADKWQPMVDSLGKIKLGITNRNRGSGNGERKGHGTWGHVDEQFSSV